VKNHCELIDKKKCILSIVTPFFCNDEDEYLYERIILFIEKSYYPEWIERIIVDFGSPAKIAKKIESKCNEFKYTYINLNKGRERFSIGKCRNAGAKIAKGEYISFADVDLHMNQCNYEIILQKISKNNPFNYLESIPCFYLTKEATESFLIGNISYAEIFDAYKAGDSDVVKAVAPATSCILLKKHFYLSEGGIREEFYGHGYEDFELMNRLGWKSNKFKRPHDFFNHNFKYDSREYKGYRTYFSMFGRENLYSSLFYVHLEHKPISLGYKNSTSRNKVLFEGFLKSFEEKKDSPPALDNLKINRKNLFLGWKHGIPFLSLRELIPLLGEVLYKHETDFYTLREFAEFIDFNKIEYIYFLNPYGNEDRLNIYNFCKKENYNIVVFDRGALPNSWFFDRRGFNADSRSYDEIYWNKEISDEEEFLTEKYINELCVSDDTLEANGARIGSYLLRKKYNILEKKIIFVPMQRPNDSVIKYFSGSVSGIQDFMNSIRLISSSLSTEWVICVKQHPLEKYEINIPGCIVVDEKTHVHDLIEMSDLVILINSGVGLISACFGKPVFCFGKAFYASGGLATSVATVEEVLHCIKNLNKYIPDRKIVLKFINYLAFNFYSFAKATYIHAAVEGGKSSKSVAINLEFSQIRINEIVDAKIERRTVAFKSDSPVYDFFRTSIAQHPISDDPVPANDLLISSPIVSVARRNKKIKKLLKNPLLFFKDALINFKKSFV
jgi:predicted glycosyltransferase involved in capsule biosynthesis